MSCLYCSQVGGGYGMVLSSFRSPACRSEPHFWSSHAFADLRLVHTWMIDKSVARLCSYMLSMASLWIFDKHRYSNVIDHNEYGKFLHVSIRNTKNSWLHFKIYKKINTHNSIPWPGFVETCMENRQANNKPRLKWEQGGKLLTHCERYKISTILQTTFSNAFPFFLWISPEITEVFPQGSH